MTRDGDWWIAATAAIVLVLAGRWAFNTYEIRPKETSPPRPIVVPPLRPTGFIRVTEADNGTIWFLSADSVTGPRSKRFGWLKLDFTANRSVRAREQLMYVEANCDTGGFVTRKVTDYDRAGKPIAFTFDDQLTDVPDYATPNSVMASGLRELCHKRFDQPANP